MISLGTASIVNQVYYLGLVAFFYIFKIHFVQHQVQLDAGAVTAAIEKHRQTFTDKRTIGIVVTKQALESGLTLEQATVALGTFSNKASALLKLESPVGVIFAPGLEEPTTNETVSTGLTSGLSDFQFRVFLTPIKANENSASVVIRSSTSANEFELRYRHLSDIQRLLDKDVLPVVSLILDPATLPAAKSHKNVHIKLMFLVADKEDREQVRAASAALQRDASVLSTLRADVGRVAGPQARVKISQVFEVKNTLNPMINMMNPNQELLKPRLQKILEDFDYELSESTETQALNVLIEVGRRPISAGKKFTTYRHGIYLKTSAQDIAKDLLPSVRLLALEVFGLSHLFTVLSDATGKRDFDGTLELSTLLRQRRILALSLNALETVEYVNNNPNLRIKDDHLPAIATFVSSTHEQVLQTRNFTALDEWAAVREHNFFESTYIFEQYVYGLLALVFISSFSPLLKVVKERLFGFLFALGRKKTDNKPKKADVSLLSVLEWLFEKDLVALDDKDLESDCEDTDPVPAPNSDITEDKKEK